MFTLQVQNALTMHGNPNAPGQQKKAASTPGGVATVRVIQGQTLVGVGRNALPFSTLAVGDRVQVWGAVQPDGTVNAVRVQLLGRAQGPLPAGTPLVPPINTAPGVSSSVRGVIAGIGGALTLITEAGVAQSVTLATATTIRERGLVVGAGALHPYDIVTVQGTVSGGTLVASVIDVEFNSATATQVTGSIGVVVPGIEGITVGTTIVGVHPDAFVIQGMTRLGFSALTPGRVVTVYGTSVALGPLPFGIQARVVVLR